MTRTVRGGPLASLPHPAAPSTTDPSSARPFPAIRFPAALLLAALLFSATAAHADRLTASRAADGTEIASFDVPPGSGWCVLWRHSVKGFDVSDCYENRGGHMVLVRSHQPDFAAGLGHIPGRGRQVSDGWGGYVILDIDEPVPGDAYLLRPGLGPVDHRLQVGGATVSLSAAVPRERVRIALEPH